MDIEVVAGRHGEEPSAMSIGPAAYWTHASMTWSLSLKWTPRIIPMRKRPACGPAGSQRQRVAAFIQYIDMVLTIAAMRYLPSY